MPINMTMSYSASIDNCFEVSLPQPSLRSALIISAPLLACSLSEASGQNFVSPGFCDFMNCCQPLRHSSFVTGWIFEVACVIGMLPFRSEPRSPGEPGNLVTRGLCIPWKNWGWMPVVWFGRRVDGRCQLCGRWIKYKSCPGPPPGLAYMFLRYHHTNHTIFS